MGIDVELHWSFILFILALLVLDFAFFLILSVIFIFVTIHEFCHSIVALRNGIKVKKILIIPIGGMAQMDMGDLKPWTEFKMAIAGPLFNFAAAGVFFALSALLGIPLVEWVSQFLSAPAEFSLPLLDSLVFYSFYANMVLGIFNLFFPAFPLDGGRVFRSLLAMKYPYLKATQIAKYVSYVMATLLFLIGFSSFFFGSGGGIWIMAISIFIGLGAAGEYKALVVNRVISKLEVDKVISSHYPLLDPNESIKKSLDKLISFHRSNGVIIGDELSVIDLDKMSKIKREKWGEVPVGVVSTPVRSFNENADMEKIFKYASSEGVELVPVVKKEEGKKIIKGVIYLDDLERVIQVARKAGGI